MAALASVLLGAATWLVRRSGGQAARRLGVSPRREPSRRPPGPRRAARRRPARSRDEEVVTLCAALAAELRAGLPPAAALASAAEKLAVLGPRLAAAAVAVGRGARVGDELTQVAADEHCPRLRAVAAVCAVGETTGSGVAAVLERVGRGLAADDEAAAELAALSAGPRATAAVLAALPAVATAMATALGLAPLRVLLHSVLGGALLAGAGLLEVAGVLWVRRITTAALRG